MWKRMAVAGGIASLLACEPLGPVRNDSAVTQEDQAIELDLLANDDDVEIGIARVEWPLHGTLAPLGNLPGRYRYTPDADFHGEDIFAYELYDGRRAEVRVRVIADGTIWREDGPALATAATPFALAALDVDRDGVADLAVHDLEDLLVTVLVRPADATRVVRTDVPAAPSRQPSFPSMQGWLLTCRLDGDASPDLLLVDANAVAPLALLARTPPGEAVARFDRQQVLAAPGQLPIETEVAPICADFTGDGQDDVIARLAGHQRFFLFENVTTPGSETVRFAAARELPELGERKEWLAIDMNQDGRLDLVTPDRPQVAVQLPRQPATGVAFDVQGFQLLGRFDHAVVADVNGDGRDDLVGLRDRTIDVMFNSTIPGSDTIDLGSWGGTIELPETCTEVAAGDFDGDGRTDLAAISRLARHITLLGNRAPSGPLELRLAPLGDYAIPIDTTNAPILFGDLDGDGRDDAALSFAQNSAQVLGTVLTPSP